MSRRTRLEPDGALGEKRMIDEDTCGVERERRDGYWPEPRATRNRGELVAVEGTLDREKDNDAATVTLETLRSEGRLRGVVDAGRQLLELPVRAGRAQERSDALDRLRPHVTTGAKPKSAVDRL